MNMKEFMKRIGCNNDDAKKNAVVEVTEVNGKFMRGVVCNGDNKDRMKWSLRDAGWKRPITRNSGWVWLWATTKGGE